MGGCASRPRDFDEPLPTPATPKKAVVGEAVPQEEKNGGETKKEDPLRDDSEPPPEIPKSDESSKATDVKDVFEEAKPAEDVKPVAEPTTKMTGEPKAEVEVVAAKEAPKEEKKEVIADAVTKKPENDAPSPKDKSDAPLVTV